MSDLPEWLDKFIDIWVDHQAKRPDAPDDYLANVDHLRIKADEWERQNQAMHAVIGAQLAQRELNDRMKNHAQ